MANKKNAAQVRTFATGANRHVDTGKFDFDGFLSPLAMDAFATYMHFNRNLPDGSVRDSDNWQRGIPMDVYRKSMWRHFYDSWRVLRGYTIKENIIWALCGILFNVQGMLHELIKSDSDLVENCREHMEAERAKAWAKLKIKRAA